MKKIFLLSKQHPDLAREEVLSLAMPKDFELTDNILICEDQEDSGVESRLGFTHSILRFLFKCSKKELLGKIDAFDWKKIYSESLCLRIHDTKEFSERYIASLIYNKLDSPKIDLKDAVTRIEFFFRGEVAICGRLICDADKSYLARKAHMRPGFHPTSMHPALARACINLTGLRSGRLLDPFCGSGGILIEAALMGFKVEGYDIDEEQIRRTEKNMGHYDINDFRLEARDSMDAAIDADCIVTDPPYGRSSRGKSPPKIYESYLRRLKEFSGKVVMIFPDSIGYRDLADSIGMEIKKEFRIYVHKGLTRIIVVFSPLSHSLS